MKVALISALLLQVLVGCPRSSEPERPPARPVLSSPATPTVVQLSARLSRAAPERIVAIGDLHGDLEATRRALRLARAVDAADAWIGGNLVVVQTGDQIDRGDDDRRVLDFLESLSEKAKQAGGALLMLSGNHELMNAARDFRYVTPGGFAAFASEQGRGAAFQPGGPYARLLAKRPVVLRVGDTLFAHGGILPKHVAYGLDRMGDEVAAWLNGARAEPPPIVVAEDGPVWTRAYSAAPGPEDCANLERVLAALGSKRMVVGHTVQKQGINAACEGKVWRIDVGLAKFYGGPAQVLEIRGGVASVLK